ncbi:MAG: putative membrane protein [Candidatus Saccharimonadales bacterium]|jgi:uncharacterized membrane protein
MSDAQKEHAPTKKDVEANKVNALLSYFGILILVPLLSETAKTSPYAKFHMNQGLVLTLAGFVGGFIFWVPLIGWAAGAFYIVLWFMGLISAANGDMKKLPVIGDIVLIK